MSSPEHRGDQTQPGRTDPRWAEIVAALCDAVVVIDADRQVVAVNPAAEELLGLSAASLLGEPMDGALAGLGDAPWIPDLVSATLGDAMMRRQPEGPWRRRGKTLVLAAATAPVHDSERTFWGVAVILRDTAHAQALGIAEPAPDRMVTVGATAQGLAHEIRNPLGGIKGAAELLARDTLDAERRQRCVDIIIGEVDRLNRLVSALSVLGDPAPLEPRPVSLQRVLWDVLVLEQQTPDWGAITLRTEFDPSLPPVLGDTDRLTQLFMNLTRNAVEALGGTGELTVSSQIETGLHVRRGTGLAPLVSVAFSDDGPGVPTELASEIFTPLFSTKARGTGLGLALCQQIAAEHHGTLAYEPRRGGGSIFRVRLPLTEGTPTDG